MTDLPLGRRQAAALLILCYALAALLLASNFTGLYDSLWKPLDIGTFRALNSSIGADQPLTTFWAWTNSKLFDELTFVVMLALCVYLVFSSRREEWITTAAKIWCIALLIGVALLISKQIFSDMPHLSPGYALQPYNDLNDFISGYSVKTASENSFPGDHAMTSALFAGGLILLFRNRPYVIAFSILLMIFVCLPRLAGGGHWLTDVIIGGGAASLILLPFLKVTPMVALFDRLFRAIWTRMMKLIGR